MTDEDKSLQHELRDVLAQGGTVSISRLASPALRLALKGYTISEAPAVAGCAIWSGGEDAVRVVEWPNWLGRLEERPPGNALCVASPGSAPPWQADHMIVGTAQEGYETVHEGWAPEQVARVNHDRRAHRMKELSGHLMQTRGVAPAWAPEAPTALVLFPVSPLRLLAKAPPPRMLQVDIITGFSEFPGGVRLEVTDVGHDAALRSWSGEAAQAVTAMRESTT